MNTSKDERAMHGGKRFLALRRHFQTVLLVLLIALPAALVSSLPANARFLSPDTYDPWLQGVDINRYAYGGNDPINNSDPNGHFFQEIRDFFSSAKDRDARNRTTADNYNSELKWNETSYKTGKISKVIYEDRKLELTKLRDHYNSLIGQTDTDIAVRAGQLGLEIGSFGVAKPFAGMVATIGSRFKKGEDTVTLYRSVSRAEADQIARTGKLEAGPGAMEGKWMAENINDARTWGSKMDPGKDTKIVEIKVPKSVADSLYRDPKLDGIGPARYGEIGELGSATIRMIEP